MTGRTALVAGSGLLPGALCAARPDLLVTALEGFSPQNLTPQILFRVERLIPFIRALQEASVVEVIFAGSVRRPRLDPALFDAQTAQIVPRLLAAMQSGDDATLREVIAIFEDFDLTVKGVADIAPALIPQAGVLVGQPSLQDQADAARAAMIVNALGTVDVGQGAVVVKGLCLAVEALPGTDAMLANIAALKGPLNEARAGLIYNAPKPTQDLRIDLPTIGIQTVIHAANAGLAGIAFEAGGVILLELEAVLAEAKKLGLFVWARAA
jgi:UDP-2,3-diacylglucosamine hydrolase